MKSAALITLVFAMLGRAIAQGTCENQADPDSGIGNYCYCSDGNCYSHSTGDGGETCNPPGIEIPCP